jgi:preprotein translocase subunit SecA
MGLQAFVQLMGGIFLHQNLPKPKTGEGKGSCRDVPVSERWRRGVHVVTVNDYLAKRDARWMGVCVLGLTTGVIYPSSPKPRKTPRIVVM